MKRIYVIVLAVSILIFTGGALTFFSFKNNHKSPSEKENLSAGFSTAANSTENQEKEESSCCSGEEEKGSATDASIYQIESKWLDQSGRSFLLTDLKGKKVVLAMIFANCTYACPLIVNDMKIVEKSLGTREKEETRFVLVSIDPERDTPKALAEYAKTRELDQSRWKLLTGRHEEIKELAALLGFKYKKGEKGDYIHSNLINVFNRQGELVFQHEELNKGTEDIVEKVKILN